MLFYLGKLLVFLFYKCFCRIKFIDSDKIPQSRAIILASNHVSYYDPMAVGLAVKRKIHFMAKKELFEENRILGMVISIMGAFPVDRQKADRRAITTALEYLKKGESIGIFPEGTRSDDGSVKEGQQGAALLSIKSGAPIVPAAVTGTMNCMTKKGIIPKFKQIIVKYGDPIYPDRFEGNKKEILQKITDEVISSIRNLKKELET